MGTIYVERHFFSVGETDRGTVRLVNVCCPEGGTMELLSQMSISHSKYAFILLSYLFREINTINSKEKKRLTDFIVPPLTMNIIGIVRVRNLDISIRTKPKLKSIIRKSKKTTTVSFRDLDLRYQDDYF
jgi:hypothetical protein